jgi:hypothetical protein
MTFQVGLAEVVIDKGIILQRGAVELKRSEIENSLQNTEAFMFWENFKGEKITDLG